MNTERTVGYVVNFIMDYGNGRQVQVTGNLPLGANKEEFDQELDKLRTATDRQKAFVMIREQEAKLKAEKTMVTSLEVMVAEYEKEADRIVKELQSSPTASHTKTKQQVDNLRSQVANQRQLKMEELQRHRANVEIAEVTIASLKKEIGE